MKTNSVIIGIGANIDSQPYINKLSKILIEKRHNLSYICWSREEEENISVDTKVLHRGTSRNRLALLFHYFLWMSKIFYYLLSTPTNGKLFFLSRLDAAAPAFFLSWFKKIEYIYLDRDAAHMTYHLGLAKPIAKAIEKAIGKRALIHMIPGESRNFTHHKNVRIVENTPHSEEVAFSEKIFLARGGRKDARTTIYINGWLSEMRGMNFILDAARKLPPDIYRIIIAGTPACTAADQLISLNNVEFLGSISNKEALSYYLESDVVLSFYDPSHEINRKAEPNKWYDCALYNVKFITNNGLETSQKFVEAGLCHTTEYGNADSLILLLSEINISKNKQNPFGLKAEPLVTFTPWDKNVSRVIDEACSMIS